jgi:hypothetical protein
MAIILNGTTGITTPDLTSTDYIEGNGAVLYPLTSGTAVASTSGTAIDFTGIPSWVKKITVMFNGVSTSGTSFVILQIGAGSVETTSYVGNTCTMAQGNTGLSVQWSTGIRIEDLNFSASAAVRSGCVRLNLVGSNIWAVDGIVAITQLTAISYIGGVKSLSGTLDRVRLTTVGGADTFDAGSINIMYE